MKSEISRLLLTPCAACALLLCFSYPVHSNESGAVVEYFYRPAESRAVSRELQNFYSGAASFYDSNIKGYIDRAQSFSADSGDRGKMEEMHRYAHSLPDPGSDYNSRYQFSQISGLFRGPAEARAIGREQFRDISKGIISSAQSVRGSIVSDADRIKDDYRKAEAEQKNQRAIMFAASVIATVATGGAGAGLFGMGTGAQLAVNTGLYIHQEAGHDKYGLKGDMSARELSRIYSAANMMHGGYKSLTPQSGGTTAEGVTKDAAQSVASAPKISAFNRVDAYARIGHGAAFGSGFYDSNPEVARRMGMVLGVLDMRQEILHPRPTSISEFGWRGGANTVIQSMKYARYAAGVEDFIKDGQGSYISQNRNKIFYMDLAMPTVAGAIQPRLERTAYKIGAERKYKGIRHTYENEMMISDRDDKKAKVMKALVEIGNNPIRAKNVNDELRSYRDIYDHAHTWKSLAELEPAGAVYSMKNPSHQLYNFIAFDRFIKDHRNLQQSNIKQ